MHIAVTGATGFLGHYIVQNLADAGHHLRCWHRPASNREPLASLSHQVTWVPGDLSDAASMVPLVDACDAVVHAALWRTGSTFRENAADLFEFTETNLLGTLRLIAAARKAGVRRFIFISTCAVHEEILDDRPLDETHPLWPRSHYGAHKAALEKFIHSYGFGEGYEICALRPTGIYGLTHPTENSKWFELVRGITQGKPIECRRGGKEVHAADVSKAVSLLLSANGIAGQSFNCYDRYISEFDVAEIACRLSGSNSPVVGGQTRPRHQIDTNKLRALGMEFGGQAILEETIGALVQHCM
ncbi:MAG: nucleoside-diphosphate sugar epimerase [Planctomycetaceae bacterium]|nr:nucleoside-diphosphate sugar epimerase [Planctomycetaceae bacterium]